MANYNEIFKSQMDWQNVFVRTGNFPLDRSSIFSSYEDALAYAQGDGSDLRGLGKTSYVGQIIAVYENDTVSVYKINGKDIMDSENKTCVIKERDLEELVTKKQTQGIIAEENIMSDKVITKEKITIIGTPLAQIINPNNDLDITIDDTTDLQSLLKILLEKELYPSNIQFIEGTVEPITANPTISADINQNIYVEVGTICHFNRISAPIISFTTTNRKLINIEYGYSLSNNSTKEYSETEIIKTPMDKFVNEGEHKFTVTYNGFDNVSNLIKTATTQADCFIEPIAATVKKGDNMITVKYEAPVVSATFNTIPKLFPCSNIQKTKADIVVNEHSRYIASATTKSTSVASYTVKGAWYSYIGGASADFDFTSQRVRNLGKRTLKAKGTETVSVTTACEKVVIAFPNTSEWGNLKTVKDNGSNTIITNEFDEIKTVTVQGANNYGTCSYKVYVYTPKNRLNNGFNYTITIG